jgi:YD repeat-containing protein
VVEKRTYDELNRLQVLENVRGTEVLSKFEYTLDDAGNRTVLSDSAVGTTAYQYDNNDRLLSETGLSSILGDKHGLFKQAS